MNDQEDQLIREATGQNRDFVEPEPEETNDTVRQATVYVNARGNRMYAKVCDFFQSERNRKHCCHCGGHKDLHGRIPMSGLKTDASNLNSQQSTTAQH